MDRDERRIKALAEAVGIIKLLLGFAILFAGSAVGWIMQNWGQRPASLLVLAGLGFVVFAIVAVWLLHGLDHVLTEMEKGP